MKNFTFVLLLLMPGLIHAADTESIESVTKAVYATISGPAGAPRDWDRFRSLFVDGARLISMRVTADGPAPNSISPDEFAKRSGANSATNGFFESEIARRVETFGNIAHVFSTYESRRAAGDKPFARGINSFSLAKVGKEWKIVLILWDSEREASPLPEKYLTTPKQ